MTALAPYTVLATFILFCRIGACLMLMPGFSSPRVPMRVRLFVAIAITLALAPLLVDGVRDSIPDGSATGVLGLIFSETLIGALIGLMGRMFFLALQFAGGSIAMLVGLPNTPDTMIEETDPVAAVTSLFTLTAVILLFITDLHWEILRALVDSYAAVPVAEQLAPNFGVIKLVDSLHEAFLLAMRITAPFIVYSVTINLLFGILGKMTPQIPVYFISIPFVLAGGGIILYFAFGELMQVFVAGFTAWLADI